MSIPQRLRRRPSKETLKALNAMVEAGMTNRQIALVLKWREGTVNAWRKVYTATCGS